MGQALDKFRAGEIKAPVFLAITLRLALGKPDLSDVQWTEWQRQAATLKGDPEELAQAIQWAVNDASFWSEVKIPSVLGLVTISAATSSSSSRSISAASRKPRLLERATFT